MALRPLRILAFIPCRAGLKTGKLECYDRELAVPPNHILRRLKESVDFGFADPMLRIQCREAFGRPEKEPEMMFKLRV